MRKTLSIVFAACVLFYGYSAFGLGDGGIQGGGGGGSTSASDLSSGTLPAARIGDNSVTLIKLYTTGGTAGATTYFRGDNTWATPAGTGTVVGPATATEDNFPVWGADNITLKNSTVSSVNPSFSTINVTGGTGISVGSSGTLDGQIMFKSGTGANTNIFYLKGSNFGADLTWVLPTAAPGGANYLLNVSTDNTMGYTDPSAYATLASPTFTGTVTVPTPFTIGAVSTTTTGTILNYLTSASGTTGTASTNIVFSTSPVLTTPNIGSATGSVSGNAGTATALAADPADCSAGQVATGIAASGALSCTADLTLTSMTAGEFISTAADNTRGVTVPNTADPTGENLAAGKMWVTDNSVKVRSNDNTVTFIAGSMIQTFSFGIDNVVATDDILLWKLARAISVISVTCVASTADDIIGVLQECTAADQTSCSDLDSSDWTMTNAAGGTTVAAAALEDAALAAGAWLKWNTESVEAVSNNLTCTVQYRE